MALPVAAQEQKSIDVPGEAARPAPSLATLDFTFLSGRAEIRARRHWRPGALRKGDATITCRWTTIKGAKWQPDVV
jgi:hypothetical protein